MVGTLRGEGRISDLDGGRRKKAKWRWSETKNYHQTNRSLRSMNRILPQRPPREPPSTIFGLALVASALWGNGYIGSLGHPSFGTWWNPAGEFTLHTNQWDGSAHHCDDARWTARWVQMSAGSLSVFSAQDTHMCPNYACVAFYNGYNSLIFIYLG